MADGNSILRAMALRQKAAQASATPNGQRTGNPFSALPGGLGGQGMSPLVEQYQNYNGSGGNPAALPRDPREFNAGAFSPGIPMVPTPIDDPPEGSDRARPRRWQGPVTWNIQTGVPGSEGLKLAPFNVLRAYREGYSIVSACINVRVQEILGMEWGVKATPEAEKAMKGDKAARKDFEERRQKVERFWKRPDSDYNSFHSWLRALLEEIFVTDAVALYPWPTRLPGKGPFGSDMAELALIDGTTIKPLINAHGGRPAPPNPGYQQYLFGIPRSDYMDILTEEDISIMEEELGRNVTPTMTYRADQLMYLPYNTRRWTPYGFSSVEQAIIAILAGLKRQTWALEFFTQGTVPAVFLDPGPSITTPQQVRILQDVYNAMAGDTAHHHQILVVPGGSTPHPMKDPELAGRFDELVYNQVLMVFDVMPMELGISSGRSAQGGNSPAAEAKASSDINKRKALRPLLMWLKREIFDYVIQETFHQTDMEMGYTGAETTEERLALANLQKLYVGFGAKSIDEVRSENGDPAWGLPNTSKPGILTGTGFAPLDAPPPPPDGSDPAAGGPPRLGGGGPQGADTAAHDVPGGSTPGATTGADNTPAAGTTNTGAIEGGSASPASPGKAPASSVGAGPASSKAAPQGQPVQSGASSDPGFAGEHGSEAAQHELAGRIVAKGYTGDYEDELLEKHLPGQHNQQTHAPYKSYTPQELNARFGTYSPTARNKAIKTMASSPEGKEYISTLKKYVSGSSTAGNEAVRVGDRAKLQAQLKGPLKENVHAYNQWVLQGEAQAGHVKLLPGRPPSIEVYHGVPLPPEQTAARFGGGMRPVTSTTSDIEVARRFAGEGGTVLTVRLPIGNAIGSMYGMPKTFLGEESEILAGKRMGPNSITKLEPV